MDIKRKIYDYIAKEHITSIFACAEALQLDYVAVSWIINEELCREGAVKQVFLPYGNDVDPECSTFFSVCRERSERAYDFSSGGGRHSYMKSPDLLGNTVSNGDTIMFIARDGRYLTTEVVKACGDNRCYFDYRGHGLSDFSYRTHDALFSVTALGLTDMLGRAGESTRDALGNNIAVGDIVLFVESGYRRFQKGTVLSLTKKTCIIGFPPDCHGQTTGRRYYRSVISLTKLNLENIDVK